MGVEAVGFVTVSVSGPRWQASHVVDVARVALVA
jgi:hypothetical protein